MRSSSTALCTHAQLHPHLQLHPSLHTQKQRQLTQAAPFFVAESVDIVKPTMFAALNLKWPSDKLTIYVCDDGRRDAMREMVESAQAKLKSKGRCAIIIHTSLHAASSVMLLTCTFTAMVRCRYVDLRYTARDKVKGVPHHGEGRRSSFHAAECAPAPRIHTPRASQMLLLEPGCVGQLLQPVYTTQQQLSMHSRIMVCLQPRRATSTALSSRKAPARAHSWSSW